MRLLLVAGSPEPSSSSLVSHLAVEADQVLAIDRGAEACRVAGVVPDAFCGDADTVSAETLSWVREHAAGTPVSEGTLAVDPADDVRERPQIHGLHGDLGIRIFPPAKYDTDLSLGFACARQIAAERGEALDVTVTCASAGRMDHALAVFGVLASNADVAPVLVEDAFECRILAPNGVTAWEFGDECVGSHFSFVALADASVVSERRRLPHPLAASLRPANLFLPFRERCERVKFTGFEARKVTRLQRSLRICAISLPFGFFCRNLRCNW